MQAAGALTSNCAIGAVKLSTKARDGLSVLDDLRMSGCMKALFPRAQDLQTILINSSGGLTGGDQLSIHAEAGKNSHLTMTTQAAERAYRSINGTARVETTLRVGEDATLFWLPQELILFDGAALDRTLTIDLHETGRLLMVEPVLFGRTAMGETVKKARFHDRISVDRGGRPLYRDAINLGPDMQRTLTRRATTNTSAAMASVVMVSPDVESHLPQIRKALPPTAGASLLADDVLSLRIVAKDGFDLRRALLPVLDRLTDHKLPKSWRL